ncbi:MAG TPA: hypothetical protein VK760_12240, partial [Candidatus Acidoferrales bacterium]|nr:hypothetical protein [Candidatus Acidoferrales bacterium]
MAFVAVAVAGCARGETAAHAVPAPVRTIVDRSSTPCTVSFDGVVWYRVPAGPFPPIDVRFAKCGLERLSRDMNPPLPRWARPEGATQARFIAASLQQI